ncbi:MAG: prepilin-type N-terminal cleavage/methylation domain-containing protein [Verrucomicrobiota bacterium]
MTARTSKQPSGFTLLELVLAMLILTAVIGMVFGTARTSLALGRTVTETQNEEMLHQAFFDLLEERFKSLPGNTRFELKSSKDGNLYVSDLTLQNVPLAFTWGGVERIAKAVRISTVKRRSGFLDIVLQYYENEILEDSESTSGQSPALAKEPFAEIVLMENVAYFEWRVLDGRSMEWQYDWEIQGRCPLQAELLMGIGENGREIRRVFWIPPRQNPEVFMRQLQMQARQGQNAGNVNNPENPGGEGDGNENEGGGPKPPRGEGGEN